MLIYFKSILESNLSKNPSVHEQIHLVQIWLFIFLSARGNRILATFIGVRFFPHQSAAPEDRSTYVRSSLANMAWVHISISARIEISWNRSTEPGWARGQKQKFKPGPSSKTFDHHRPRKVIFLSRFFLFISEILHATIAINHSETLIHSKSQCCCCWWGSENQKINSLTNRKQFNYRQPGKAAWYFSLRFAKLVTKARKWNKRAVLLAIFGGLFLWIWNWKRLSFVLLLN